MEVTLKYTELVMVAIIIIQIIALITINLNLKILKNGLQKKKKPTIKEKKLQSISTDDKILKRPTTPVRDQEVQTQIKSQARPGRNSLVNQKNEPYV